MRDGLVAGEGEPAAEVRARCSIFKAARDGSTGLQCAMRLARACRTIAPLLGLAVGPRRAPGPRGRPAPPCRPSRASRSSPRPSGCAATCGRASTSASSARARPGSGVETGRGRAVGPPAEARERLPPRLPGARVRRAHPRRRRRAHGRGAAGGHHDHVHPRHLHRARSTSSPRSTSRGCWSCSRWTPAGPLEIVASFRTVLQYAWPGGLGGQYAFWSEEDRAFVLSESLRRRNALVGSPWATRAPRATRRTRCPTRRARSRSRSTRRARRARWSRSRSWPAPARARRSARAYRRLLSRAAELYDGPPPPRRRPCARTACGSTRPDDRLDLALEWAKVNLDEQRVCNPDLGCGLVAGWGPVGRRRAARLRLVLRRRRGHQLPRDGGDGAVGRRRRRACASSRSTSARTARSPTRCRRRPASSPGSRSTRTPTTTPTRRRSGSSRSGGSGGRAATRRSSTSCGRRRGRPGPGACPTTPTATGSSRTRPAGLGAIEVGAIGEDIHQDVYLAAVWTRAAGAMAEMAAARGEADLAAQARGARGEGPRARSSRATGSRAPGTTRSASCARGGRTTRSPCGRPPPPRSASSSPPTPRRTLEALSAPRADRRLGRADADDREPPLRPDALQHGRGVALRDRLRRARPLPVRAAVGRLPARGRARAAGLRLGARAATPSCSRAPTTGRSTPPSRTSSSPRRCW